MLSVFVQDGYAESSGKKHNKYTVCKEGGIVMIKRNVTVDLYDCPDCGFEFNAIHENDDGSGYDCPLCEVEMLQKQVEFNRKYGIYSNAMKEIERLRKALEEIRDRRFGGLANVLTDELKDIARKALEGKDD